ncbi:DNA-binding beta-propeller fold protein YncE [Geoalkalibacter ferrihydriticus]|uniref:DNA-binding beta-propeller fold protein YncE n=1 Tax=Geoalkalibacter ferrihydriticus TaxID=392333 RepID=A0A1G9KA09_9BACT|nr:NHL repeat-containing protein [Geoalkalibacter ferrihydriticus]SDL46264.1 DNA-binding beta-propeller fold protein YncE [Geoalkalibacter ferrihydriticus]
MNVSRLISFRVFMTIFLCLTLLLVGCGSSSSHRSDADSTHQMGGSIQGKELALTGETATIFGAGDVTPDGYRTSVVITTPYGITADNDSFYVSEMFNHTIRKIEMTSGEVTTLAGVAGSSGSDDSSSGIAQFAMPLGITTDGTYLYVCDGANHTIRQVEIASGLVSTLAGGAGDADFADGQGFDARFDNPNSIATDGTHLYVTDLNNHAIRRIVIATGEVTTLAGSARHEGSNDGSGSAARFYFPNGIAVDGGNLYVVDTYNHTIRRIVIETGEVTTLAGSAGESGTTDGLGLAARFNEPRGISLDGDVLYVTDGVNNTVRKVVITTGEVTTVAGIAMQSGATDDIGTQARFNAPRGIMALGDSLYVSDTENSLIRAVDISTPENTVVTFAGFISHEFADVTTDGTNLYVSDFGTRTIQKINIATGVITTLAGRFGTIGSTDGDSSVALFNYPQGITTDGTNLYVTDYFDNTIRMVSIASGEVSTLAGTSGTMGSSDGIGNAAEFSFPYGITTDGTNLYVSDMLNQTIRQILIATGEVTTLAGSVGNSGSNDGIGPDARFFYPLGITTDGTNLYVADYYNKIIRQVEIATGAVTTLAGSAGSSGSVDGIGIDARFSSLSNITTDGTNLYVSDFENKNIRQVVIATGEVTTVAGNAEKSGSTDGSATEALFDGPTGITTDGKRLYILDDFTRIRAIR